MEEKPTGIELFHGDGRPAGVFYCSECRIVFKTKDEADMCHGEILCACGKPRKGRFYQTCDECWQRGFQARETEKEQERFERAKKVALKEYTGEQMFWGDRYFSDIDELEDYVDEDFKPQYVWGCKNIGLRKARIDSLIEPILDNAWEDAEPSDLRGIEELEKAIREFNEANASIPVYEVDYSTAIVLDEGGRDAD